MTTPISTQAHATGYSHVPSKGPEHEGIRQRLDREEKERQDYLASLTDADIQSEEDSAAARHKALLDARVAEAKKLQGHRTAPASIVTRGIEYVFVFVGTSCCVVLCVCAVQLALRLVLCRRNQLRVRESAATATCLPSERPQKAFCNDLHAYAHYRVCFLCCIVDFMVICTHRRSANVKATWRN